MDHSKRDEAWLKKYDELKQFMRHEGHCNVPTNLRENENRSLAIWVNTQRTQYKKMKQNRRSSITLQRIQLLENIGFQWSLMDPYDFAWYKQYKELEQFKCREGHCNVPRRFSDNKSLAVWVNTQRTQYKKMKQGKRSSMTEQRIQRLEIIGFQWSIKDPYDDAWDKKYEELKQYKDCEGHCNVPVGFSENKRLARWVSHQRTQYMNMKQGKPSSMTEQRILHLENIGFQWSIMDPYDDAWYKQYEELKLYKECEGHCNVPFRFSDNRSLALWVSRQRQQYKYMRQDKPSSMTEQRIQHLENIGFQWSVRDPNDNSQQKL